MCVFSPRPELCRVYYHRARSLHPSSALVLVFLATTLSTLVLFALVSDPLFQRAMTLPVTPRPHYEVWRNL